MNRQFIDITWLSTYGLRKENVLDYFYQSPFYESASNNEVIRSQGVSVDHLVTMTGMEYAVDDKRSMEPHLYVIVQQYRQSSVIVDPICYYYCLDGIIYQCPVLLDILKSKLFKISFQLTKSFVELRSSMLEKSFNDLITNDDSASSGNDARRKATHALPELTSLLDHLHSSSSIDCSNRESSTPDMNKEVIAVQAKRMRNS